MTRWRWAMRSSCAALVLAMTVLAPPHAGAHGRRMITTSAYAYPVWYWPPAPVSVVYPAPVYVPAPAPYVPAPVAPAPPLAPAPLLAPPSPAPPSQGATTAEPPLAPGPKGPPSVTESRSFATSTDAGRGERAASVVGTCRVGFWNVSGRDVTLLVDGRPRVLPRNQSVTLWLARQFHWQIDQRTAQTEQVPAGRNTLEIVIRR